MSDYPYAFERTATVADVREQFEQLAAGESSGKEERVAGRVVGLRRHGRLEFADLRDGGVTVQLMAQAPDAESPTALDGVATGDIVGVAGEVIRTRRGELSVRVETLTMLAKCRRLMPEKWHGITDVEARYRRRHLDLIANADVRRYLEARAVANRAIRAELDGRGFLEVETPLLQPQAGGALARPFVTHVNALGVDFSLRIAPELYLKRLLIGGLDRIYELNKSFRNEGLSPRHLFEFTMLEGYETYVDYHHTMRLVEDLVRVVAVAVNGHTRVTFEDTEIDLAEPFRRATMFEVIEEATGTDLRPLWDAADAAGLRAEAERLGVRLEDAWPPGKVLAEIFEVRVERGLVRPTFVTGFPKDVSPLARDHREIRDFTEQADLIMGRIEIAPIYSELNDADEQRRRFARQADARAAGDDEAALPDDDFVEALSYGMAPAGGFGLGVDRLIMLVTGAASLREIVAFPPLRPED